jgi:hypothetical protein
MFSTGNEFDTPTYWAGTVAQMQRWGFDLHCLIKGLATDSITPNSGGAISCTTVWTTAGISAPILPSALVGTISAHGPTVATMTEFLYSTGACTATTCIPGGVASFMDVILYHMKPGNPSAGGTCGVASPGTLETAMVTWVACERAGLQPSEWAKPIFNDEGGSSSGGWNWSPYNNATYPQYAESFISRFLAMNSALGLRQIIWYDYKSSVGGLGLNTTVSPGVNTAYNVTETWLANNIVQSFSTSAPGTAGTGLYTYTVPIVLANGETEEMIWDNSQTCSSGSCTTTNQATTFSYYNTISSFNIPVSGGVVPVGIIPILLHN